jgi:cholesterol transport system auxiliary component
MLRSSLLALLLASAPGCALLTKSEPVVPRYFTPETLDAQPAARTNAAAGLSIRIGRVGGGSYLKERMTYRDSDHEVGFYEDRRWTERPEVYLQRAIERSFFEARGVKRALSPSAPTLTVDLIEFEEVRGAIPRVRLLVSYALHDERTVFRERSFALEQPLTPGPDVSRADRVAAGLGDVLRGAVSRIVDEVIAELTARSSSPT